MGCRWASPPKWPSHPAVCLVAASVSFDFRDLLECFSAIVGSVRVGPLLIARTPTEARFFVPCLDEFLVEEAVRSCSGSHVAIGAHQASLGFEIIG
jgi:hypothetical protein